MGGFISQVENVVIIDEGFRTGECKVIYDLRYLRELYGTTTLFFGDRYHTVYGGGDGRSLDPG